MASCAGWRSIGKLLRPARPYTATRSYGKGSRPNEVFIVSSVRTPIGSFRGCLSALSASKLGSIAIKEAVVRAEIQPEQVRDILRYMDTLAL